MKLQLLIPTLASFLISTNTWIDIEGKKFVVVLALIYWVVTILFSLPKWYKAFETIKKRIVKKWKKVSL